MLQLIKRCPEYAEGYKASCQAILDHAVSSKKEMTDREWRKHAFQSFFRRVRHV